MRIAAACLALGIVGLGWTLEVHAQEASGATRARTRVSLEALPDAPQPQQPSPSPSTSPSTAPSLPPSKERAISASGNLPSILAPQMTRVRLTAGDKFGLYLHQAFNPVALFPPAVAAGFGMAFPRSGYPREWRDGAGAYGRLYGDALARRESNLTAGFLAAAVSHEDTRYLPSTSQNAVHRLSHAVLFTLVDRSDSGHSMPAFSNYAGAAASGIVGMGYLPRGYDDWTHAGQRSAIAFATFAGGNVLNEFCPEWGPLVKKLRIPFIHPPCADRLHSAKP